MKLCVRNRRRDVEILFLRDKKGLTFDAIGAKYDITKARARQLYYRVSSEKKREEKLNKQIGIGV